MYNKATFLTQDSTSYDYTPPRRMKSNFRFNLLQIGAFRLSSEKGDYPKMNLTRRDFVKTGGASALAIAALSGSAIAFTASNEALETLTSASFSSLIGSEFYVWNESGSTIATLRRVDTFQAAATKGESFGLLFDTRKKQTSEGTFFVFNTEVGNLELFMTATNVGRRGGYYATFNRI
jgi:hypothetical protein